MRQRQSRRYNLVHGNTTIRALPEKFDLPNLSPPPIVHRELRNWYLPLQTHKIKHFAHPIRPLPRESLLQSW